MKHDEEEDDDKKQSFRGARRVPVKNQRPAAKRQARCDRVVIVCSISVLFSSSNKQNVNNNNSKRTGRSGVAQEKE